MAGLPDAPEQLAPDYRRARPCAIVLDNYSVHRSALVKTALPELERVGVDAVLIGELLMRSPDPEAACRALAPVEDLES